MYKVNVQDLELIQKTLKMAQHSMSTNTSTATVKVAVAKAIKFLDDNYLKIKPVYAQ